MVATIPYNWMPTVNAAGTFNVTSSGGVQGMYIDAPATRFELRGGFLANSETLPMWGGVGINVTTTPNTGTNAPVGDLGGSITRATTLSVGAAGQLLGFSVFNQAYNMAITAQNPVPLTPSYGMVNYFLFGSNAQMYVACSSTLATAGPGGSIAQQCSWDFVGQQLIPYVAAYAAVAAGGITAGTYTSSTGILSLTFSTAPLGAGIGATADGAYLSIAGITQTGTAVVNGNFPIVSTGTSGTVINLQTALGAGASTLTVTGATLAAGGGALPVDIMDILVGNSLVVNTVGTAATPTAWTYTGTVAVIKL